MSHLNFEVVLDPFVTDDEPPCISIDKLNWRNSSKGMFIETFNDNLIESRNDILQNIDGNINEAVLYIGNLYHTSAKSCRMVECIIADEYHAFFFCPKYVNIKKKIII